MSPRKPSHSIDAAVGRVDATALDDLQENFDTHELLELIDALDEWRGRIGDSDGLRADLLRLHAIVKRRKSVTALISPKSRRNSCFRL
jgi:hypothetical protein